MIICLCLYVGDKLIFGTNLEELEKIKSFISSKFSMEDIGKANVILGIKIIKDNYDIFLLNLITFKKYLGVSISKIAP